MLSKMRMNRLHDLSDPIKEEVYKIHKWGICRWSVLPKRCLGSIYINVFFRTKKTAEKVKSFLELKEEEVQELHSLLRDRTQEVEKLREKVRESSNKGYQRKPVYGILNGLTGEVCSFDTCFIPEYLEGGIRISLPLSDSVCQDIRDALTQGQIQFTERDDTIYIPVEVV